MSAALRAPHIICFKSKRPQAYSRGTRCTTLHRAVAGNNIIPSFHGLGSANKLDMLCVRAVGKATPMRSTGNTHPMVLTCRAGMNVVFVGAEAAPWSKTGGLGDVLAGLPPALAARGHRVMSVTPRYDQYSDAWDTSVVAEFKVGKESHNVRFFHSYKDGVDRVFVDSPLFLEKVWGNTGLKLYGPIPGEDYRDNERRFSLLCQAALEAPRILNLTSNPNYSGPYGEDVVFVCNDWHTSLLPIYLNHSYKKNGIYRNAKSVHCIHNISYQGRFPFEEFENLGLPEESKNSLDFTESSGKRKINWIKGGIMETDKVLTVSPYYAEEIVSSPYKGMELENTLKKTGITGILNGMDDKEWNPSTDNTIPFKYDISTVMKAKPLVKEAFQAELGLPVDQNIPLIGFIARLEEQKGPDVFTAAIPEFMGENVQVVALGTGKKKFEKELEDLEEKYPNKLRSLINYSPSMVHKIVSGCDFMLIPSRFEPCGLIQLHAMKYGTVPIVASTGGLVDSVIEGYTGFHMGALNVDGSKVDPRDVSGLASTVKRAIGVYGTPTQERLVKNCMSQDFSWKEPAKKWEKVLRGVGAGAPIPEKELTPSARTVLVAT